MSHGQSPASASMSQTNAPTSPSSNIEHIFDAALKSYQKKTKQDLKKHDLFQQLEKCDSPAAILAAFQDDKFGPSQTGGDDKLKKWLVPTLNVLYAFSETLGGGVALVFSPARVIFAGAGVLLLAAKDVAASQDILFSVFERIESFFKRLETYTDVSLTSAMTYKMVEITVEVLDILATATKEMKQSRTKKFAKRVAGRTDLEDGVKKLDKLTLEEVAMASAQTLRIAHKIDNKVTGVGDGLRGVDEKMQVVVAQVGDVKYDVKAVSNKVDVVDERVQVLATAVETKLILQDDMTRRQMRERLGKWQSPPDPSTNHRQASNRQYEGTAEWFIKHTTGKFGEWKMSGSLLWIHGKPGSGKSVLCSSIVNNIATLCNDGSATMAYFYFDFRDTNKQARRNLLHSLLLQLAHRSEHFCDLLYRLYEEHDNSSRQPSDSSLMQCLKEMLSHPNKGPLYLIMDAVDECPDTSDVPSAREGVLNLIKDLVGLQFAGLHICITSRPEVDINDALGSLVSHTVSLQDESGQKRDIADYVQSVVNSDSGRFMKRWRQEDKEHVIETLSERADGMFRWVFCQLEMLRNCLPQNVRGVLKDLPKSLDETYERILKEIGKVNPHQAYRLLQCLTVATRPLLVEELAEVLALDFDGATNGIPALNKDWRWDDQQQGVLSTCSSLVVIVDGIEDDSWACRVVQFSHFSVKEFLTSDRLANLKADISRFHIRPNPAHAIISQACLTILLQRDDDDRVKSSSPLLKYAARHWVVHAQAENVSLCIEDGLRRLFDPAQPYLAAWVDSYDMDEGWPDFSQRPLTRFSAQALLPRPPLSTDDYAALCLYYASLCGFHDLTKFLISEYSRHVNAAVGLNKSLLGAALRNKHWKVAELLYRNGADVNVTGRGNRTLLHVASEEGIVDVARWLLDHGADASSQKHGGDTPLHLSAANGHLELVRTLLGHGVDANAPAGTDEDSTPLGAASKGGHVDVVRLLIQHGADANTHLQDLLLLASSSGSLKTVQLFIELGADVSKCGSSSTPLHLASSNGSVKIVRLLIEHGADVHGHKRGYWTPLYSASSKGHAEVMRLLIKHGADVNPKRPGNSTPLHYASSNGDAEAVQLLLQHGAEVNALNEYDCTPLLNASYNGSAEAVRLLIEHGADVNVRDRENMTPLQITLSLGDSSWMSSSCQGVIQLLIGHGAGVNAPDESHSTPLHLASSEWNAETVEFRLVTSLYMSIDIQAGTAEFKSL